ncbi:uncharacterized protein A4U43_C09F10270 [Asparagus officinalis]|uniref:Uncharacterized protein n=1 Tax=Asparagus officinalis TaxID=4686 RepID=A0A5P1EBF9_ASPOF|nr:uncharacterized protein A4U43_C09F10270 [Asparagus officinalis]
MRSHAKETILKGGLGFSPEEDNRRRPRESGIEGEKVGQQRGYHLLDTCGGRISFLRLDEPEFHYYMKPGDLPLATPQFNRIESRNCEARATSEAIKHQDSEAEATHEMIKPQSSGDGATSEALNPRLVKLEKHMRENPYGLCILVMVYAN